MRHSTHIKGRNKDEGIVVAFESNRDNSKVIDLLVFDHLKIFFEFFLHSWSKEEETDHVGNHH